MGKQHIILLSGGMDSSTVLATVCKSFSPIHILALGFDYGQRHREMELTSALRVARHLDVEFHIIDLTSLAPLLKGSALTDKSVTVPDGHYEEPSMKLTVVPNRNAIMLAIAFGVARGQGAINVWAGMHAGDHHIYPDCRPDFVAAFNHMEKLANSDLDEWHKPHLVAPFLGMHKYQIVQQAHSIGLDLSLTYSCYNGQELHCGTCGTCTERREAFVLANVPDPTSYRMGADVSA